MTTHSGSYARMSLNAACRVTVSHAGSVLLLETVRAVGRNRELSAESAPGRKPLARHGPAKVLLGLAVASMLGDV
jgi:hypothetical protein